MKLKIGRRWAAVALVAWVCAVTALAVSRTVDVSAAVVLFALAPLMAGLALSYRWHRTMLRRFAELNSLVQKRFEVTSRMFAEVSGRLDAGQQAVESMSAVMAERAEMDAKAVKDSVAEVVPRVRQLVSNDLMQTYRQLEALQNLYAVAKVAHPLPSSRNWAASPDLLLYLVDLVERERPNLIVECGSGLSTVWFALALKRYAINGRVISLEHLDTYAEKTRHWIELHGVSDLVEIRVAGLETYELAGKTYQWYADKGWSDLSGIDLLFVDGPPTSTGTHARYPALPLLRKKLSHNGVVVLDDMVRKDEQETLASWLETFQDFTDERVRLEKHAALLRQRGPDLDSDV